LTGFVVVVVKDVVLKLRQFLTHNKHLVFGAAGIKLKDIQVGIKIQPIFSIYVSERELSDMFNVMFLCDKPDLVKMWRSD
jgi:hypothetical protein